MNRSRLSYPSMRRFFPRLAAFPGILHPLSLWERRHPLSSFAVELGILLTVLGLLGYWSLQSLNIAVDWGVLPSYFLYFEGGEWRTGPFIRGLGQTLLLSAEALILTLILGYGTACMRLSRVPTARFISYIYVELIRTTPLLVQLYIGYFVLLPLFGLSSFGTALIVLSLFEGAYTSEIIRATILSIPKHQYNAGLALGMSDWQVRALVVHPQALLKAMPILASQGVSLIKDSALASGIGVFELTRSAQSIQDKTFQPFEPWLGVSLVYFALTFSLSIGVKRLEKKWDYNG